MTETNIETYFTTPNLKMFCPKKLYLDGVSDRYVLIILDRGKRLSARQRHPAYAEIRLDNSREICMQEV